MRRMKDKIRTMRKRNHTVIMKTLFFNVKNMIKKCKASMLNILKEVGFDVSNIEVKEKVCTSLAANIDTTYLFIQPIKKEENVN